MLEIHEINYFENGSGRNWGLRYNNQVHNKKDSPKFKEIFRETEIKSVLTGDRSHVNTCVEMISRKNLEKNVQTIFLGGDHGFSQEILKGISEHYKKVSVLNVDAHSDNGSDYDRFPYRSWYYNLETLFEEHEASAYVGNLPIPFGVRYEKLDDISQFKPAHPVFLSLDVDVFADDIITIARTSSWIQPQWYTQDFGVTRISHVFEPLTRIDRKVIPVIHIAEARPGMISGDAEEVESEVKEIISYAQKIFATIRRG